MVAEVVDSSVDLQLTFIPEAIKDSDPELYETLLNLHNAIEILQNAVTIAIPVTNVDTAGATLLQLETEVNELKQLLRDIGVIAP